jgi:hypothetical protein
LGKIAQNNKLYFKARDLSGRVEFLVLEVEFEYIKRNIEGGGNSPGISDADVRKHREQTGFDTLVVYAVNDEY